MSVVYIFGENWDEIESWLRDLPGRLRRGIELRPILTVHHAMAAKSPIVIELDLAFRNPDYKAIERALNLRGARWVPQNRLGPLAS